MPEEFVTESFPTVGSLYQPRYVDHHEATLPVFNNPKDRL